MTVRRAGTMSTPGDDEARRSARKASDVLTHTSARTNELVLRKAAVENEANRFRFRFDVESRKKRDALMSRVNNMSGSIDAALTPTSITAIGAGARRPQSATVTSRGSGGVGGSLPRTWTPGPDLLEWMSAPASAAQSSRDLETKM